MPTDIEYREGLNSPYASYRNVEVYGDDKSERLAELPREMRVFEEELSGLAKQIKEGRFAYF